MSMTNQIHLPEATVVTVPIFFETDPDVLALQALNQVHFRAHLAAGWTPSSGGTIQCALDTVDWNVGGGIFAGSTYTCGLAGYYTAHGVVSGLDDSGQLLQSFLVQNGTVVSEGPTFYSSTTGQTLSSAVHDVLHLDVGDTVDLAYVSTVTGAGGTGLATFLILDCIGPY